MKKLTEEVKERLCEAFSKGATTVLACCYAGVAPSSFYTWIKLAENQLENHEDGQPEDEYLEFYKRLKKTEATAALDLLDCIEAAAKRGQWQAAAWKLERRYPDDYGRSAKEKSSDIAKSDDATDEERADRVASLLDQARTKQASERLGDASNQGNDA